MAKKHSNYPVGKELTFILASTGENLFSGFANNKVAYQPANLRSLISAFVIRLLESIISRLSKSEISIF